MYVHALLFIFCFDAHILCVSHVFLHQRCYYRHINYQQTSFCVSYIWYKTHGDVPLGPSLYLYCHSFGWVFGHRLHYFFLDLCYHWKSMKKSILLLLMDHTTGLNWLRITNYEIERLNDGDLFANRFICSIPKSCEGTTSNHVPVKQDNVLLLHETLLLHSQLHLE